MARIEITLNSRSYAVSCEDGQEARLREIASFADAKLRGLSNGKAGVSETQLLVLALLTMADQVFDLRSDLAKARTGQNSGNSATLDPALEESIAAAIDSMAERVNQVASKLASA